MAGAVKLQLIVVHCLPSRIFYACRYQSVGLP